MKVFSFSFVWNDESSPVTILAFSTESLNRKVAQHLLGQASFLDFLQEVQDLSEPESEEQARLSTLAGFLLDNQDTASLAETDLQAFLNEFFTEFLEVIDGFAYEEHELFDEAQLKTELHQLMNDLEATEGSMNSAAFNASRTARKVFRRVVADQTPEEGLEASGFATLPELAQELKRVSATVSGKAKKALGLAFEQVSKL